MDSIILSNLMVLVGIAFISALVLYMVSKKFKVKENPLIDKIEQLLPGANCGACGKAGCRNFAESCVKADAQAFQRLYCSVGGNEVMQQVATVLGLKAGQAEKSIAVLKCNGSCSNAPAKINFDAPISCRLANRISVGQSGCPQGCLRLGDCIKVCKFGALSLDPVSGLPVVDENKCTACGACVKMCPRNLFVLRPQGQNGERVYVACSNIQKGALARKNCKVACIGCMKCTKICPDVVVNNNLSEIPPQVSASRYGAELAKNCPTGAIIYHPAQSDEASHE